MKKNLISAIIFTFFNIINVFGVENNKLSDNLPVNQQTIFGKLDNGIQYYIRKNTRPENRAELRLVVNAGSILEDDDQQGLAHFVEHMAFNGTKNFEKHQLVDYLESIGMKFGPEINAYTSFDETVYMLQISTDSVEIMDKAFQILADWSCNISFNSDEIEKERDVIIEEWRQGRGAEARMRDKHFPVLFKDSQYAKRLVIGKKEIIESCSPERLIQFYKDWYRPDLISIVAVGDFEPEQITQLIREKFSGIQQKSDRKRLTYPVPNHENTLYSIVTDPEASQSRVSVYYKRDVKDILTVSDYRDDMVSSIFQDMFNQRLSELTSQADPPYIYAYFVQGRYVRTKDVFLLSAAVKETGTERGLHVLLTEAARVQKYGFTQNELERSKLSTLRSMEKLYNERDKTESRSLASELVRHILENEPIPGIDIEYDLYKSYIPAITLQEVNSLAKELIQQNNRAILVNLPEKDDLKVPSEADFEKVTAQIDDQEILPYDDQTLDEPLIAELPPAGQILLKKSIRDIGVEEWTLSNGVKVVLKQTDFKNDQILFSAFSPGGHSLVPDSSYVAALTTDALIQESGVGKFNKIQLEKKLAGKIVNVEPYINSMHEGFYGDAVPQDFETLFKLVHLYFTSPRMDSTTFSSYKNRLTAYIKNKSADPVSVYKDSIRVILSNYHFRSRPYSVEFLQEMDLNKSFQIFKDRFADAGDFTFFFVGAFNTDSLELYSKNYLANLPSIKRNENWKDNDIYPPKGVVEKNIYKGLEPKSKVRIIFTGPYDWNLQNNYILESMIDALDIKLREVVREDKGGTYSVSVAASKTQFPHPEYEIHISFGCDPERVQELTDTIFTQIDSLGDYELKDIYLDKVTRTQIREFETDLRENNFWLSQLSSYYFNSVDPTLIPDYKKRIDTLTLEQIRKAVKKYFNTKNYIQVNLFPEKN